MFAQWLKVLQARGVSMLTLDNIARLYQTDQDNKQLGLDEDGMAQIGLLVDKSQREVLK